MTTPAEAAMTTAHAESILALVRGHMGANRLGVFFTRDEMLAALHLLDEARAERNRLAEGLSELTGQLGELRRESSALKAAVDRLGARVTDGGGVRPARSVQPVPAVRGVDPA